MERIAARNVVTAALSENAIHTRGTATEAASLDTILHSVRKVSSFPHFVLKSTFSAVVVSVPSKCPEGDEFLDTNHY